MGIPEIAINEFLGKGRGIGVGCGIGNGYSNGNGRGYGNGSSCSYSNGDSNGDGNGNGNGYGCSYGDGFGHGYGRGDGFGHVDGSGDGFGRGYSYGIKRINNQTVHRIDNIPTVITYIKGNIAKGYILEFNVYLKPCYIIRHGRYFAHGETIHKAREALEEKLYADMDTEEAIERFAAAFPKTDCPYAAKDFYVWHNRLTGSCEMGRKSFALTHDIDIENDKMTVREFVGLTKDSFGGGVIRALAAKMGIEGGQA